MTIFEDVIEFLVEEVIDLGRFAKGTLLGLEARQFLEPEVLADPHAATAEALECLSNFISERSHGHSTWVKDEVTGYRLMEGGLVNILFACLPEPEEFEEAKKNLWKIEPTYTGFKELITYLSGVVGRKGMENICDDPLLGGLFSTIDRAVASSSQEKTLQVWEEELRHLAWDTRANPKASTHKPLTVRLLAYLRWDVQGRKEELCNVEKPESPVDAESLRRASQRHPARPLSHLSQNCANCSAAGGTIRCKSCQPSRNHDQVMGAVYCTRECRNSDSERHAAICQETRNLSRLALLFQITFVQYLLSVNYGTTFFVKEDDGVVKCFQHYMSCHDPDKDTCYVGVAPELDLSLPMVEAALHGFRCCDIEGKAIALLEYFFRGTCCPIELLSFVPKNAHTPLEVEDSEWFRFNMSTLHRVVLLTTESGRKFILDPTAAQFGWKEHLVTKETYFEARTDYRSDPELPWFQGRPRTPTEHTWRPPNSADRGHWTSKAVAEDVLEIAEASFMEKGGIGNVLELPEAQFHERCLKLEESLRLEMPVRDRWRLSSEE